jgi:hypothetical protein
VPFLASIPVAIGSALSAAGAGTASALGAGATGAAAAGSAAAGLAPALIGAGVSAASKLIGDKVAEGEENKWKDQIANELPKIRNSRMGQGGGNNGGLGDGRL